MPEGKKYKIVYCTPALYMAGGVERVLTLKANYFAEHFGYDITIILTEGKGKPFFYPISDKVKIVNLNVNFEDMWRCSFIKKVIVYIPKQYVYKKRLTAELMRIRPDITVSLLRREINFITKIKDGSKKIGELHINRANYRNFGEGHTNILKSLFSKFWMKSLVSKLKRLDKLVVLTEKDKKAWEELDNVLAIPNPLPIFPKEWSSLSDKRVIVVGRYSWEKGYDLMLQAWSVVQERCSDWRLDVYGDGDRTSYEQLIDSLRIDRCRCRLHGRVSDVQSEYVKSSLSVCSSRFEGFGLVLVEAMSCGLPVVSFDCPWGPRSIIMDGIDGILVENGNVNLLADAMMTLMNDAVVRKRMSQNAVRDVQRYKIDQISCKWRQLFDSL